MISHDDLLDCVARRNAVSVVRGLGHDEVAADVAEFLSRGGKIEQATVSESLRCETAPGKGSTTVRRWVVVPFEQREQVTKGFKNGGRRA